MYTMYSEMLRRKIKQGRGESIRVGDDDLSRLITEDLMEERPEGRTGPFGYLSISSWGHNESTYRCTCGTNRGRSSVSGQTE